jgi:hypothetical protein
MVIGPEPPEDPEDDPQPAAASANAAAPAVHRPIRRPLRPAPRFLWSVMANNQPPVFGRRPSRPATVSARRAAKVICRTRAVSSRWRTLARSACSGRQQVLCACRRPSPPASRIPLSPHEKGGTQTIADMLRSRYPGCQRFAGAPGPASICGQRGSIPSGAPPYPAMVDAAQYVASTASRTRKCKVLRLGHGPPERTRGHGAV